MVVHGLSSFLAYSSFVATALATGLTGGEKYASTRRINTPRARSMSSGLVQDGLSFALGSGEDGKMFFSPIGAEFTSYALAGNWGLSDYAGQTLPVTVFTVEGNVTCDALGHLVSGYLSKDDVFDEVTPTSCFFDLGWLN